METENTEAKAKEENTVTGAKTDLTFENHPLLTHINLYIFCSIYLVPDLQDLAFSKMTACFTDLERPNDLDTQLAVISALRVSFHLLPAHDPLLDWMAQYAAYCIDKLRIQGSFHDLLKCSPMLASRMVHSLNPASLPPWQIQRPMHSYPHYDDRLWLWLWLLAHERFCPGLMFQSYMVFLIRIHLDMWLQGNGRDDL